MRVGNYLYFGYTKKSLIMKTFLVDLSHRNDLVIRNFIIWIKENYVSNYKNLICVILFIKKK